MKRLARLGVGLIVLVLLWFAIGPAGLGLQHTPLVGSPEDYGIRFETVTFQPKAERLTLHAWWMPVEGAKAVIIMVHGGGDNRSHPYMQWLRLARALIDHRYAIMDLDLRNHGESDDAPRGPTFGVDEAADVSAAIDCVAPRAPGARFAGLGYSMGGQTLLYAAASDPRLEAVVSDASYADVRAIVPNFAHAATGLPAWLFPAPFVWSAEHLHGVRLGARAVDVIGRIAPRHVLLIHDAADPIVPVEHCHRLAHADPAAEVWITSAPPGAATLSEIQPPWGTHAKSYLLHPEEYVRRVTDFYDGVFAGGPSRAGSF